MLAGLAFDFTDLVADAGADGIDEAGVGLLDVADLFAAGLLLELLDHADDFDDDLVAELDGIGDVVFLGLARAGFDHVDVVLGAGDDDVDVAVFELLDGGIDDQLAVDAPDAHVGDGGEEGDVADGDGAAGGDASEDVGIVLAVEGERVEVDLHLIHEALGEERAQGAIDQAGGEDFLVGGAAFALHEPAGELAGGGAALAVVDLERKEVDAFARVGADDGAEDDGLAVLDCDGAIGQLGERPGLDRERARERAPADLPFNFDCLHYE